jgi:phage terminase Nu1 subunit (DNA packaging protein)
MIRKRTTTRLTVEAAAREIGVSRETLRRNLRELGEDTKRGKQFTLRTIYRALTGDLKGHRVRLAKVDADLAELEFSERAGNLVSMEEVQQLFSESLQPVRQRLLALPAECATRANPTDPQFARQALQEWVDQSLPMIREQLPKRK